MSKSKCPMVPPRSWKEIEEIADDCRRELFDDPDTFFREKSMLKLFENRLGIIGIEDYGVEELPYGNEGQYQPQTKTLILSNDTYEKLHDDVGRANFTLAHEIGHAVLHGDYLRETLQGRSSIETFHRKNIISYRDPECQANQFASTFLMPRDCIQYDLKNGLSVVDIANKYKVSFEAATIRCNKIQNNL